MSAYFVFTREKVVDEQEMAVYSQAVSATFVGHPMKVHAAYGAHEEVEGPANDGTVILEFPDVATAKAWYDSDSYKKVREHRFKGGVYTATLVQGV